MVFSSLSKECLSRSFQVLRTVQAQGGTETAQEATACRHALPRHYRLVLSEVKYPQASSDSLVFKHFIETRRRYEIEILAA